MPEISAQTLDRLSHRLQTNRSWFDIYFRTNNVNLNGDPSKQCPDSDCRRVQNCAISHVDYAEYQYCVERGDGFGDNDIVGLAYDITSDASKAEMLFLCKFHVINVPLAYLFIVLPFNNYTCESSNMTFKLKICLIMALDAQVTPFIVPNNSDLCMHIALMIELK